MSKVKQFEIDLQNLIIDIQRGYGWIDRDYVEETWDSYSDTISFTLVKDEVYRRLTLANLLTKL